MIIKWNGLGPLSFTIPKALSGKVNSAGSVKVLLPGHNEVDDKVWASIKKNPIIDKMIDEKKLELVTTETPKASKTGPGEEVAVELSGMNAKMAAEVVAETYDLKTLNKWLESDSRRKVVTAVEKQIKRIKTYGEEKESA